MKNYSRKRLKHMYFSGYFMDTCKLAGPSEALEYTQGAANSYFWNSKKAERWFEKETGQKTNEKELRKRYYLEHSVKYNPRKRLIEAYEEWKEECNDK